MLVDAKARTPWRRLGSSTIGAPWTRTAAMAVCQETPNSRATSATLRPSLPTWRQISRPPGEHAGDERALLGEGRGLAVRIDATPPPASPHEAHRPARDRHVPAVKLLSSVSGRPHLAARAPDDIGGRLDKHRFRDDG